MNNVSGTLEDTTEERREQEVMREEEIDMGMK